MPTVSRATDNQPGVHAASAPPATLKRTPIRLGVGLTLLICGGVQSVSAQAPSACDGEAMRRLRAFEGDWQVDATFRVNDAESDSITATATISRVLSGCLLREEYSGTRYGEPYSYIALWGGNGPVESPYQRTFAHSQHGYLELRQGTFAGDTLTFRSETKVRGQAILQEDRFTAPDAAGFTMLNRRSADGGHTWTVTRRALYRRPAGRH